MKFHLNKANCYQIYFNCLVILLFPGQYKLEVENGNLLWFHRNETLDTVFSAITDRVVIQPDTWVEIVVMYDSTRGRAVIYIDGQMVKEEISDQMKLSQDWGSFAGNPPPLLLHILKRFSPQGVSRGLCPIYVDDVEEV